MEIAKLVSWQYVLCKLGEMIRETKENWHESTERASNIPNYWYTGKEHHYMM